MNDSPARIRMFAGPNGSGKSTLRTVVRPELLGAYVNADDIEQHFRSEGKLNLSDYHIAATQQAVEHYFQNSSRLPQEQLPGSPVRIRIIDNCLYLDHLPAMSYYAAVTAEFIRNELLRSGITFSFETVMSHGDKVEILRRAQVHGYRTYLYFIATDDPAINVSRVKLRVSQGGHDVPEDKIRSRYVRSLDLLLDAIRVSNRAYIFDNSQSGQEKTWLAEVTEGKDLEMKSEWMPDWFKKAVWDKINT